MELVYGKVFQTVLTGFLVGGGLSGFRSIDDRVHGRGPEIPAQAISVSGQVKSTAVAWWKIAIKEAALDGVRAGATIGAGMGVFGACSFILHGRYNERFFQPRGDGLSVAAGTFAASLVHLPPSPGYQRAGTSAVIAAVAGFIAAGVSPPQNTAPP